MKKIFPIVVVMLLTLFVKGQRLDQSYTGAVDYYTCTTDGQIVGQSFTAGITGALTSIKIDFGVGTCTLLHQYQFVASIISGNGYGGTLLATDTVTLAMPYARNMLPISFSPAPNVVSGQLYTITLTPIPHQVCDSMMNHASYVCAHWYESDSDSYEGGSAWLNGTVDSSEDKYFQTYVLACGEQVDQVDTGSNNYYTCTTDGQIVGQSFTCGQTGTLTGIGIDFMINPCSLLTQYQFITDIINGAGYGGSILATDTVTVAVPYGPNILPISFSPAPTIVSGQVYTIRLTPLPQQVCDSMLNHVRYVCAEWFEADSDTYAGGAPWYNGLPDTPVYDKYFITEVSTNSSAAISVNACGSYTSPSGKYTWTSSNIYHDTIPNSLGCDSILTINLSIPVIDTSITASTDTLLSNTANAAYKWVNCSNAFTPITGDTGQTLITQAPGIFAVIITKNGCTDTTACIDIIPFGLSANSAESKWAIYPNPASGYLIVTLPGNIVAAEIKIINPIGETAITLKSTGPQTIIDISKLAAGVYMLQINSEQITGTKKFIRE